MFKQKLIVSTFLAGVILASCEDNMDRTIDPSMEASDPVANTTLGINSITSTTCDITGPTVIGSSNTGTYTLSTDLTNPSFQWSILLGTAIIDDPTSQTTTITLAPTTKKITLKGYVTNGIEECSDIITITRGDDSGTPCTCPNPQVNISDPYPSDPNRNCSLSSTGLYTVTVSGVQSGDVLNWTGNSNVNIQNGQGTTTMAFYIYNTNADFVVNCTVTRTCADGTVFTRTATYGSNVSQECQYYAQYTSGECAGELEP